MVLAAYRTKFNVYLIILTYDLMWDMQSVMKVLLIEDDKQIGITLKEELEKDYIVKLSHTGEDGEYQAEINGYDLIILDLGLPDRDGLHVCRTLRERKVKIPILVLTGDHDTKKKVSVLDAGADDYLTKPFSLDELMARIRALIRRQSQTILQNTITVADLTLDYTKKTVMRGSRTIHLRKKGFHILEYLLRNSGKVVSRDMIWEHVWNKEDEPFTNTVDVHINYLRDQIDEPFDNKLIKTVHGLGYKIEG